MENKKITLNEFWSEPGLCAIHCDTEEKFLKLLTAFDKMGKKWSNGTSYLKYNLWGVYEKETCYSNRYMYAYKSAYLYDGNKVYEFEEIEL